MIKADSNKYLKYLFCIVYTSMILCGNSAFAQNNPYNIKDSSYSIFSYAIKNKNNTKLYLHIIDSLEVSAIRINDLKAQCIVYQMRSAYAGQLPTNKEREAVEIINNAKEFTKKTPYKQYYFASWNCLLTFYARHGNTLKFYEELLKIQKEAVKMKNAYGISNSYKKMGDFYLGNLLYNQAIEQYEEGLNYLNSINDNKNKAPLYSKLGETYLHVDRFEEAEAAFDNYLKSEHDINYDQNVYACKVLLALRRKDSVEQVDDAYNKFKELIKNRGIGGLLTARIDLVDFLYYSYKKDEKRANEAVDKIFEANNIDQLSYTIPWLVEHKEYEDALGVYSKLFEWNKRQSQQQFSTLMTVNQIKFGLDRLEKENRELLIHNQNMKLESQQASLQKMNIERQFLLTNREKDSLAINYSIFRHKSDSIARAQDVDAARTESKNRSQQLLYLFIVLMIFIISGIVYFVTQRRNSIRLRKEKKISDEARKVAEEAMYEAKRANELKSQFLNNMSHEIRTPLNAIVGFTDIINSEEGKEMDETEKNELLNLVHTNSELLTTLINDLLDLSRIQTGNYRLCLENFNLSDLCKEALASVKHRAPECVELEFVPYNDPIIGEMSVILNSDKKRVMQVIINFLTNACKYTEEGSIKLSYTTYLNEEKKEWIDIAVTDTGIGIPEDKATEVFNRFEKLNDFKQGTGLGLNICLSISQLLNGRVWLDNSYKNGCRFVFSLPM